MNQRVWVVTTTDETVDWTHLGGIGATEEAALRIVAGLHDGQHGPAMERFADGSSICRGRLASGKPRRTKPAEVEP